MKININIPKLNKLLSKYENSVIDTFIDTYYSSLKQQLKEWKAQVRMLLSTPYTTGRANRLYPFLRTGRLRNSLTYRTTRIHYDRTSKKAIVSYEVNWNPSPAGGANYGEILNSSTKYKDRRFFGWKDRTYNLLYKRIRSIV